MEPDHSPAGGFRKQVVHRLASTLRGRLTAVGAACGVLHGAQPGFVRATSVPTPAPTLRVLRSEHRKEATWFAHPAPRVGLATINQTTRWGPGNTVAFGGPTNGWGPYEVHKRPGWAGDPSIGFHRIACPCVVAYDPFNKAINGGVPTFFNTPNGWAPTLTFGVRDQAAYDAMLRGGPVYAGGFGHLTYEGGIQRAIWGQNFDPTTTPHTGSR